MKGNIAYSLALLILALFAGCGPVDLFPDAIPQSADRVLFVYMAVGSDSDISRAGLNNINEMMTGANAETLNDGQIVVFCDSQGSNPRLIRIFAGIDGLSHQETLVEYGEDLDSSDPETLKRAFADMQKHVKYNSVALAFGSHGTGWMSGVLYDKYYLESRAKSVMAAHPEYPGYERIVPRLDTRALLYDTPGKSCMELDRLVEALATLQSRKFDYIMLDLCYMGGVETAFAMRNLTDRIVFSPAEVIMRGMPYHVVMPHLFATPARLGDDGVCMENIAFFEKYDYRSATMTLIDCTKFDRFAAVMEQIVGLSIADIYGRTGTAELQHYDRNNYSRYTMFDIREFVRSLNPPSPLMDEFQSALDELVLSKQTTGRMFDLIFDPERYSGLSTYVPVTSQPDILENYQNTEWFKRVYPEV